MFMLSCRAPGLDPGESHVSRDATQVMCSPRRFPSEGRWSVESHASAVSLIPCFNPPAAASGIIIFALSPHIKVLKKKLKYRSVLHV